MPIIIALANITPLLPPKLKDAIAGPGHRPANPHPIPKNTEPIIRSRSIPAVFVAGNLSAVRGVRTRVAFQAIAIGSIAPPITKAKVGSHSPNMSNQPCTFLVSVMPDMIKPRPNKAPETKLINMRIKWLLKNV
jgi:hypothetical protein